MVSIALNRITIRRPDDWHVHLRDGALLEKIAPYTARQFGRAIVMPNLVPPIVTVADAQEYRDRILAAVGLESQFTPLMTCYLTDGVVADELIRGHAAGVFTAAKLYPAHTTTNSAHGVSDVRKIYPALEVMQQIGMPLLVHGEVTDPNVDIFDREAVFIERILTKLVQDFPALKIVLEHITTAEAAQFVAEAPATVGATITPQHLMINRNALFEGGLRPHAYCLPVLKRERHRLAVRSAATSGDPSFFLGTDSAPHEKGRKENCCGFAGIFNAPFALESYATVFEEEDALERFEAFASEHGPGFYGLPLNTTTITLERAPASVPDEVAGAGEPIIPFQAGETLRWRFVG